MSSNLAAIDEHNRSGDRKFAPIVNVEGDKLLQTVHATSEYARLEVSLDMRAEEQENAMHASSQTTCAR